MSVATTTKALARGAVLRRRPWVLWPSPEAASSLQIERKFTYLQALHEHRHVPGVVLEVGCYLGGTAAMGSRFLRRTGTQKRHVCIDTFGGFVPEQYAADRAPAEDAGLFAEATKPLVSALLRHWGEAGVELVQGDICKMQAFQIPGPIAVCLLDVDLERPILMGLQKLTPKLSAGGLILVDDCPESTTWAGARAGYETFCHEAGLKPEYIYGFGVVRG